MIRTSRGIPAFNENSVLKLIIAAGSCYVIYKLAWAILLVADANPNIFPEYFTGNIAMPAIERFPLKIWTVLTYGWVHEGFWMLFSNMVWLYTFGSLVQMLVGHKQLFPIFIYSLVVGGLFYQLAQLLPGAYFAGRDIMTGAQAGVVGLAVAALTLAPDYKFSLSENFRIPLVVVAIVFFVLQLMNANIQYEAAPLFMISGGALMGFVYVRLLRSGYRPGEWVYDIFDKVNNRFEPDERAFVNKSTTRRNKTISMYNPKPKQGITQSKIDAILDKINHSGYDSLSKEDRETLMKAAGNDKK
ncbi:MAG: rhomboid family intramembrane serine protease [Chitinophagales bacterium]|nr:rhomboid family intramembrane serine protease [Chitinophagales bacterium]